MTTITTLVIGGTGKTGHRAAGRLAARGLPVPVGSRSGELPSEWEAGDVGSRSAGVRSAQVAVRPPLRCRTAQSGTTVRHERPEALTKSWSRSSTRSC